MSLPWTLADDGEERVWVSKYAGTELGVIEVIVGISDREDRWGVFYAWADVHFRKGEWHRTETEAIAAGKVRVMKRIASLKRRLQSQKECLARLEGKAK